MPRVPLKNLAPQLADTWSQEYLHYARQGNTNAMLRVAELQFLQNGFGKIAYNPVQAKRWLEYASVKGNLRAQYTLRRLNLRYERILALHEQLRRQDWNRWLVYGHVDKDSIKGPSAELSPSLQAPLSREAAQMAVKAALDHRMQHTIRDFPSRPIIELISQPDSFIPDSADTTQAVANMITQLHSVKEDGNYDHFGAIRGKAIQGEGLDGDGKLKPTQLDMLMLHGDGGKSALAPVDGVSTHGRVTPSLDQMTDSLKQSLKRAKELLRETQRLADMKKKAEATGGEGAGLLGELLEKNKDTRYEIMEAAREGGSPSSEGAAERQLNALRKANEQMGTGSGKRVTSMYEDDEIRRGEVEEERSLDQWMDDAEAESLIPLLSTTDQLLFRALQRVRKAELDEIHGKSLSDHLMENNPEYATSLQAIFNERDNINALEQKVLDESRPPKRMPNPMVRDEGGAGQDDESTVNMFNLRLRVPDVEDADYLPLETYEPRVQHELRILEGERDENELDIAQFRYPDESERSELDEHFIPAAYNYFDSRNLVSGPEEEQTIDEDFHIMGNAKYWDIPEDGEPTMVTDDTTRRHVPTSIFPYNKYENVESDIEDYKANEGFGSDDLIDDHMLKGRFLRLAFDPDQADLNAVESDPGTAMLSQTLNKYRGQSIQLQQMMIDDDQYLVDQLQLLQSAYDVQRLTTDRLADRTVYDKEVAMEKKLMEIQSKRYLDVPLHPERAKELKLAHDDADAELDKILFPKLQNGEDDLPSDADEGQREIARLRREVERDEEMDSEEFYDKYKSLSDADDFFEERDREAYYYTRGLDPNNDEHVAAVEGEFLKSLAEEDGTAVPSEGELEAEEEGEKKTPEITAAKTTSEESQVTDLVGDSDTFPEGVQPIETFAQEVERALSSPPPPEPQVSPLEAASLEAHRVVANRWMMGEISDYNTYRSECRKLFKQLLKEQGLKIPKTSSKKRITESSSSSSSSSSPSPSSSNAAADEDITKNNS